MTNGTWWRTIEGWGYAFPTASWGDKPWRRRHGWVPAQCRSNQWFAADSYTHIYCHYKTGLSQIKKNIYIDLWLKQSLLLLSIKQKALFTLLATTCLIFHDVLFKMFQYCYLGFMYVSHDIGFTPLHKYVSIYNVVQKNVPFSFLNNSVKNEPISIIFGTQNPE